MLCPVPFKFGLLHETIPWGIANGCSTRLCSLTQAHLMIIDPRDVHLRGRVSVKCCCAIVDCRDLHNDTNEMTYNRMLLNKPTIIQTKQARGLGTYVG